jgi:hypothetical protein
MGRVGNRVRSQYGLHAVAVSFAIAAVGAAVAVASSPPGYHPLSLSIVRRGGVVQGVRVAAAAPFRHALLQLRVLHNGSVVYMRTVAMTDLASPRPGPLGKEAEATWSGTLRPDMWQGGCARGRYTVTSRARNSKAVVIGGSIVDSGAPSFSCRWPESPSSERIAAHRPSQTSSPAI